MVYENQNMYGSHISFIYIYIHIICTCIHMHIYTHILDIVFIKLKYKLPKNAAHCHKIKILKYRYRRVVDKYVNLIEYYKYTYKSWKCIYTICLNKFTPKYVTHAYSHLYIHFVRTLAGQKLCFLSLVLQTLSP